MIPGGETHEIIFIILKTLTLGCCSQHIVRPTAPAPCRCGVSQSETSITHRGTVIVSNQGLGLWETHCNGGEVPLDQPVCAD